ncbi:acyl-CoA synthetase [Antrihabitans cavernicola]|uniref:Acyl-CoA synthetase n=1 Tax=Antrihabitans cavernicola TaxID=2495913 RepID=A0A5A7SHU4_9NOCA|nr:acyl-CoA synthetase [Spelaeibacter cavernicola]KAA0024065.1 acyl-CoA synthetase [Spelaeibacter cavernicola]
MISPQDTVRKVGDLAKSANVLRRSGLFNPLRPDEALRSTTNVLKYGPFAGVVMHGAHRHPSAPAIVDELGTLTFQELDDKSNALARGLAAQGIGQGSVIAALARDHRGLVLSMLAAGKLGARLVMMNTGFAKPQFADVTKREKVQAVLHDSEFFGLLEAIPSDIPRIITWVDEKDNVSDDTLTLDKLIDGQSTKQYGPPSKPGGMIILTSGTTGTPKGAPRDRVSPLQSAQFLDRIPLPSEGTVFMAAPIFHSTGLSQFTIALALGNKVVFQRRFKPETTVEGVAKHKADALVVVPTMLQRMIDLDPDFLAKHDTKSLKVIFAAGSSVSPDLSNRTAQVFGDVLYNLYGSTEVAVATVATPTDLRKAPGTVGKPPVGVRVVALDENDKKITKAHQIGRLFVSSGLSFAGYTDGRHKNVVDGMLSSGDVGHFDENGLWFVDGRDDDMIVSGGENVYPLEVENLLADREDVHDAAVVGVDDADFGKRLRAFIVAGPSSKKDVDEIKNYVKDNLARYKVPREVIFLDELPRNATGKLLRKDLVEMDIDGK